MTINENPQHDAISLRKFRNPLAQLLHALNQPLTGLQCSMEVALASPRTPEQYAHGLREGLKLTERMRALVGAIREIMDIEEQEEKSEEPETIELETLLKEILNELEPVAKAKSVGISVECAKGALHSIRVSHRRLAIAVFHMLESSLSLADHRSALQIQTGSAPSQIWIRISWHAERRQSEFSRPELGLMVARAGWERIGAEWERERIEVLERVTVRLPVPPARENP